MAPSQSRTSLTQNAIHSMISGDAFTTPPVVRLFKMGESVHNVSNHGVEYLVVSVCDRVHSTTALLPLNQAGFLQMNQRGPKFDYIIAVEGYVTSAANSSSKPVLILTRTKVVQQQQPLTESAQVSLRPIKYQPKHVQGGAAGSFLADSLGSFSDADLAGSNAVAAFSSASDVAEEQLRDASKLLAQHAAHMTLHNHASTETNGHGESAVTNYIAAVKEFSSSQLDRQEASLTSHIDRAQQACDVVRHHTTALQTAMNYEGDLTPQVLCQWHSLLFGDGRNKEAGKFRKKAVRAGTTRFAPVDQLPMQVEKLCQGARILMSRLRHKAEDNATSCLDKITFAASVMFAVVDVHPFNDGNGRMARITANWALSRAGFPFPIHMFATRTQRQEYVQALQHTRRNTHLMARGDNGDDTQSASVLNESFCSVGLMLPIVRFLLGRVSKACHELQLVVSSKSLLVSEEVEARAARRFREKAAEGNCIICFDEKPNIATLCCGKAVHLNCIAQWLSSKDTCPQCRAELPTMERIAPAGAAAPPEVAMDEQDEDNGTTEDDSVLDDADSTEDERFDTTDDEHHVADMIEQNHFGETTEEDTDYAISFLESMRASIVAAAVDDYTTTSDHSAVQDDGGGPNVNQGNNNDEYGTTTEDDETINVAQVRVAENHETISFDETTTTDDEETNHGDTTISDGMDATTTDDDTEPSPPPPQQSHPPICVLGNCRNRSAIGCRNSCCGRCCVLHGYYHCERHNS